MSRKKRNKNPEINDIIMGSPAEPEDQVETAEDTSLEIDGVEISDVVDTLTENLTAEPVEVEELPIVEAEPILPEEPVVEEIPVKEEQATEVPVVEEDSEQVEVAVEENNAAPTPIKPTFRKQPYYLIFAKNPSPLRKNTIEKKLKNANISYEIIEEDGSVLYVSRNYSTKEEAIRDRKEILKIGIATTLAGGR